MKHRPNEDLCSTVAECQIRIANLQTLKRGPRRRSAIHRLVVSKSQTLAEGNRVVLLERGILTEQRCHRFLALILGNTLHDEHIAGRRAVFDQAGSLGLVGGAVVSSRSFLRLCRICSLFAFCCVLVMATALTSRASFIPRASMRSRLCSSNSCSVAARLTVSSLLVLANWHFISFPASSKPLRSVMAFSAASTVSKTMKAWPLRLRLFFATMSMIVPYSENTSRRLSIRAGILTLVSRLLT